MTQYTYLTLFTLSYCRAVEQLADAICRQLAIEMYEQMSLGIAEDNIHCVCTGIASVSLWSSFDSTQIRDRV